MSRGLITRELGERPEHVEKLLRGIGTPRHITLCLTVKRTEEDDLGIVVKVPNPQSTYNGRTTMYEIDKELTIEEMCQGLIDYLNVVGSDTDTLMIRAINIASIQLDHAKYEVGVVDKERRMMKRLMVSDAESGIIARLIAKKRRAKKLSMALDRLVAMAGDIG